MVNIFNHLQLCLCILISYFYLTYFHGLRSIIATLCRGYAGSKAKGDPTEESTERKIMAG